MTSKIADVTSYVGLSNQNGHLNVFFLNAKFVCAVIVIENSAILIPFLRL